MSQTTQPQRVYTMTDYFDGPRGGVADFEGRPHVFRSLFQRSRDDAGELQEDVFVLKPIDLATLELMLEDWEIWLRWECAFKAGQVQLDTHPALPSDRARHDEIRPRLKALLELPETEGLLRARGRFTQGGGPDCAYGLQAVWTPISC